VPNGNELRSFQDSQRLAIATTILQGMIASEASGSGQLPARTQASDVEWRRACAKEALAFADALIEEAGK
jgi:hypothetical protein